MHIERGDVLDIVAPPNQKKYPYQKLLIVEINNYAFLVPFVENENGRFLKTIIPSRKATRDYLGGKNEARLNSIRMKKRFSIPLSGVNGKPCEMLKEK